MTESTSTKSPIGTAAQAEFCQAMLEHPGAPVPSPAGAVCGHSVRLAGGGTGAPRPLGAAAQAEFCQVLLEHLHAGLPVAEGLASLARGARSRPMRRAAARLRDGVGRGLSLGDAMSAATVRSFPPAFVALLRASERSGALADVLDCHLRQTLRQKRLLAQVRGTVLYPILSVWASVAALVAVEVLIVPRMVAMYAELGAPIVGSTQLIIDISDLLRFHWDLLVVPVGVGVAWQVSFLLRRDFGGRTWRVLGLAPPFKAHFRRMNSATFLGMAGGLLRCGVALPEALGLAGSTLIGEGARRDARHAKEMAESGSPADHAAWFFLFLPDEARELLKSPQSATQPARTMEDLADYYDRRMEKPDSGALNVYESIVIILAIVLLGMLVEALYLPFFLPRYGEI